MCHLLLEIPTEQALLTEEFPKFPTYLGHGDVSKISTPLNWGVEHSIVLREETSLGLKLQPGTGSFKDSVPLRYTICSPEVPVKTPFRPGFKEKWTSFSQNCKMKCHYGGKSLSPRHDPATSLPLYVFCKAPAALLAARSLRQMATTYSCSETS